MKIIIFGATGQTGVLLVDMALKSGHEVTAYVRNPDKIKTTHENLKVVVGSTLNADEVSEAIKGHEAVISCLGGEANKKSTILTDMTKVIVDGMKSNKVDRIAYIATAGIHNEMPGLLTKIIISLLFKNVINDHIGATDYIMNNGLKYTIARPLSLVEGKLTKIYRETLEGIPKAGRNISREDLAYFLLDSVENGNNIGDSIGLSY